MYKIYKNYYFNNIQNAVYYVIHIHQKENIGGIYVLFVYLYI